MKNNLLAGAAALALIAGMQTASAQGMQQERNQGGSPSMKQERPSSTQGERPGTNAQDVEKKAQQGAEQNQKRDDDGARNRAGSPQNERPGTATTDAAKKTQQGAQQNRDERKNGQATTDARSSDGQKAAKIDLNSEQRTRISQTVKNQKNVKRVTNVNFNISVGTVVPRSYTFYPVPATVVSVVPAWRGFVYILVGDEMLVIHPRTYEIVAVIAV